VLLHEAPGREERLTVLLGTSESPPNAKAIDPSGIGKDTDPLVGPAEWLASNPKA
jgi:hypothetical protein